MTMTTSPLAQIDLKEEFRIIQSGGFQRQTELCRLMSSFGSDKAGSRHNYTVLYDGLLRRFRNEPLTLFELGIGTNKPDTPSTMGPGYAPGASLRAWRDYFPRAQILGADVDRDTLFEAERIQTFWTDQTNAEAIRSLWREVGEIECDIVIDDGLHRAPANIRFFLESFERLRPGGIYVIEDIHPKADTLMRPFAECMALVARCVVYGALEHPENHYDNRILMFHKT